MKVDVERTEPNVAQIVLEIDPDHVNIEYNKVCKRLGQRLNIPGFRRGKAPRQVVEKAVGVDRIKQEVLDRLLPPAFADAISEHQLDVVAPPQIEKYSFEMGQPLSVKAQVELRPDVKLPELTKIDVKVPKFEAEAGALEQELKVIVERMTSLESVIDRPSTDKDVVNLDFSGTIAGEPIRGGAAKNYMLDLANSNFIQGFAEQVVGHKIGEEFTIQVDFPADYHDNSLAGKKADFLIRLNEIKTKVVPELTDELAKKCGPYESLEQLKAEVQGFIDNKVEYENNFRKQKAVIDAVVDKASMEVPEAMVNREARVLLDEVQQRFKSQGLNWEQFADGQGQDKILENLRAEALRRIQTSLTFGAIARQESIVVTDAEFQAEVTQLAREKNIDEKQAMRQLANNPQATQSLSDLILSRKIVEFLISRADVTFVKDETPPASASTDEALAVASAIGKEEYEVMADE